MDKRLDGVEFTAAVAKYITFRLPLSGIISGSGGMKKKTKRSHKKRIRSVRISSSGSNVRMVSLFDEFLKSSYKSAEGFYETGFRKADYVKYVSSLLRVFIVTNTLSMKGDGLFIQWPPTSEWLERDLRTYCSRPLKESIPRECWRIGMRTKQNMKREIVVLDADPQIKMETAEHHRKRSRYKYNGFVELRNPDGSIYEIILGAKTHDSFLLDSFEAKMPVGDK